MPTERPRGDERERKEENKEGGASELHSLCCGAKEMHGRALFSNACLGVVHKGAWLAKNCCVQRRGGLVRGSPYATPWWLLKMEITAKKLYSKCTKICLHVMIIKTVHI